MAPRCGYDHVPGLDVALLHVAHRVLLVLEDAGRPVVVEGVVAGHLQHRAVGREVAGENLDCALVLIRLVDRVEEVRFEAVVVGRSRWSSSSAMVRPVTVIASPWNRPASTRGG